MADSLSETKITIQPEEEEVVSLLYPYEQITVDYERQVQKPEHLAGALQMLQVIISTRPKLETFGWEKEKNSQ